MKSNLKKISGRGTYKNSGPNNGAAQLKMLGQKPKRLASKRVSKKEWEKGGKGDGKGEK